ncbi:hypothetical protein [uncultured Pseudomonas sp.]|uniref:hypothetical protein n=1 Tax=uncultured Pseudomonas sp. TaxID=114707 RepID=UPI0030D8A0DD|tara:strand:- start:42802 stop:43125 length:324 start_codon:yes stop_codon:yes gene_type:complete
MDATAKSEIGAGAPVLANIQQAPALVHDTLEQLSAEVAAEAREAELRLQQALALPRRAAILRDLSVALCELKRLERRQLGLDESGGRKKIRAAADTPAVNEVQASGQ